MVKPPRIVAIVAAAAAVIGSTLTLAAPLAYAAEECTPVVVIALRGSGEQSVGPQPYGSQGWEGETLQRLLEVSDLQGAPILDIAAPAYPASAINFPEMSTAQDLHEAIQSSGDGAVAAAQAYVDFPRQVGCKDPLAVMVGYSQGAMAARAAAEILNEHTPSMWDGGPVKAVFLAGDPLQKANSEGNVGTGSNANGIGRAISQEFDSYYSLPGITRYSLCHDNDLVCTGPFGGGLGEHLNYFTDVVERFDAGSRLTSAIRGARVAYGLGPVVTPIKDIYGAGDTVTARYTLPTATEAANIASFESLYSNIDQCQVGAHVNKSNPTAETVNVLDILHTTVAGKRITSIGDLLGVPLPANSTYFDVTVRVDAAELARAAERSMGPLSGPNGNYEEFDTNRNGVLDGSEVYPAYARVMSGYCSDGRWDASTAWGVLVHNSSSEAVKLRSYDGPPLRFSMLAAGVAPGGGGGIGSGSLGPLVGPLS